MAGFILTLRRLARNKTSVIGLAIVLVVVFTALLANFIAPYDPIEQIKGVSGVAPYSLRPLYDREREKYGEKTYREMVAETMAMPDSKIVSEFYLGTDIHGRDILSRIIFGTRISLLVGIVSVLISVAIGIFIGALSGYFGGFLDSLLMRITDTFYAFPGILLAIGILAIFEKPGLWGLFVALGITGWTGIARVIRGQVLSLREQEFIEAARAVGASHFRIIFRHIVPNCLAPIIVLGTLGVATNILSEAGLSFLGLGIAPPAPSWGQMLADGRNYMTTKPWLAVFPGLAIAITVLGFNLFGDGLRDILDPRMKNR
ncbi:MAG: ABC transporter permease [bacterium]|jgi:ABC-type dipeptide/oligopeptide/nickel transport system permease subunit